MWTNGKSYKDILLSGPMEPVIVQKAKPTQPIFYVRDIKKMCSSGEIDKIKKVDKKVLVKNYDLLYNVMKTKICEIETWKYEDQNQAYDVQQSLIDRGNKIEQCVEYLNKLYEDEKLVNETQNSVQVETELLDETTITNNDETISTNEI